MRTKPGDPVKLFDGAERRMARRRGDGRQARPAARRDRRNLREREAVPDPGLCVAPIKKGRIDWMAEKACELGVGAAGAGADAARRWSTGSISSGCARI